MKYFKQYIGDSRKRKVTEERIIKELKPYWSNPQVILFSVPIDMKFLRTPFAVYWKEK